MEQTILNLLFGTGGVALIIATIMHDFIKKLWKPKDKNMYKIPGTILSLIGGYVVFIQVDITGLTLLYSILLYLLLSFFIMAFQLWGENEAWEDIKKILLIIIKAFFKKG